MNKRLAILLALAGSLTPCLAAAQTVVYVPWTPAPTYVLAAPPELAPAPATDSPRFRFGIGGNLVAGGANGRGGDIGTFGAGLTLDLGVQLNRRVALYAHGSASTMIFTSHAALYGVIEYTPTDLVSLGTGVGWSGMISAFMAEYETVACVRAPCPAYEPNRDRWGGVSVPIIVGLNLGRREGADGRRKAFRINLEGAVGFEPSTGALGWTTSVAFGYVAM